MLDTSPHLFNVVRLRGVWGVALGAASLGLLAQTAIAQERPLTLNAATYPLELDLLPPDADLSGRSVVTRYTVQDSQLTLPSLWWAEQQHGGKLLENWIAYRGEGESPQRVDLVVNRQLWNLYSYVERYQFVHQMGLSVLQFGYNTRVFNEQGVILGAYLCDAPQAALMAAGTQAVAQLDCQIYLDSPGIEVPRGPFRF